FRPLFLFM
ncbi:hypothetical protein CP8484711_0310B, partial [Chlamydia psittaci 84-8471/1]